VTKEELREAPGKHKCKPSIRQVEYLGKYHEYLVGQENQGAGTRRREEGQKDWSEGAAQKKGSGITT